MSADRPKVETIDDVKAWIAEHDGRIDAWWYSQHKLNEKMEDRMDCYSRRLHIVEKRMMFWAGAAGAIGAFLGGLIPRLMGG